MKACMGGWCRIRNKCPHYTDAARGPEDAERLCIQGHDGCGAEQPVRIHRAVGSWERKGAGLLRAATPLPEAA